MQFNVMHILPTSKIPFKTLPLDFMISSKVRFLEKKAKAQKKGAKFQQEDDNYTPIHERDAEATELGLVLIDEFKFPHCVFQLGQGELNNEGLTYGYKRMYQFLDFKEDKKQFGLTIIVTPKWMFLAAINQPYHNETKLNIPGHDIDGGVPVYLDGFAYAGVINL